jgi:hypothetical protein
MYAIDAGGRRLFGAHVRPSELPTLLGEIQETQAKFGVIPPGLRALREAAEEATLSLRMSILTPTSGNGSR